MKKAQEGFLDGFENLWIFYSKVRAYYRPKIRAVSAFGHQGFDAQIRFLLACLYCQKLLKMKFIIKNGIIFIQKSLLKELIS